VDAYVRWVDEEGERIRQELEAHQPDTAQLGEKLLARLAEKKLQQP
jgi:hypothetical protein